MTEPAIPFAVRLGAGLDPPPDLAGRLRARLQTELRRIGVPGVPTIDIAVSDVPHLPSLRAHDQGLPYDRDLLLRIWRAVAPRKLHAKALEQRGAGDAWLADVLAQMGDDRAASLLVDVIAELAVALVRRAPQSLLDEHVRAAYAAAVGELPAMSALHTDAVKPVIGPLLDLLGTLPACSAVGAAVDAALRMGLRGHDVVESAFSALCSPVIEIRGALSYLEALYGPVPARLSVRDLSDASPWPEAFETYESELFSTLGLALPDVVIVPTASLLGERLELNVSGHECVPARGLMTDELVTSASQDDLAAAGVDFALTIDPVRGHAAYQVAAAERGRLDAAGIPYMDAGDVLLALVRYEVERVRGRLLSRDHLDYQLVVLRQAYPAIVHDALALRSLSDVVRILRLLVDERVPARDLARILERLLELDVERRQASRAPLRLVGGEDDAPARWSLERDADAIREQFGDQFAADHAVEGAVNVLRVSPDLEDRLARAGELGLHPRTDEADRIRDAARAALLRSPDQSPVVLTTRTARRPLRAILEPAYSELAVLAHAELPLRLERRVLGTIALGSA